MIKEYQLYLCGDNKTIIGFLFNTLQHLMPFRNAKGNKSHFILADSSMNRMIYKGVTFFQVNLKRMIERQLNRYDNFIKDIIMYGETMVYRIVFPIVDMELLSDDLANTGQGYTFIGDTANNLIHYSTTYYQWLMSDPVWKKHWLTPNNQIRREIAIEWHKNIEPIEMMLAIGALLSAGLLPRTTKFTRQYFCQEGDSRQSLMILFQCLFFTAVLDKTFHQHRQKKFVPHMPSRSWAICIIKHMATLCLFAEFLIAVLFSKDDKIKQQYHFNMQPTLALSMLDKKFAHEMAYVHMCHSGWSSMSNSGANS